MTNDDDKPKGRWPFSRETDQKAIVAGSISALVLTAVVGGSGVLRWGKFTADDATALQAHVIQYMEDHFVLKQDEIAMNLRIISLETIVNSIIQADKEMRADHRSLLQRVDKLPPRDLTDRVTTLEINYGWMVKRIMAHEKKDEVHTHK